MGMNTTQLTLQGGARHGAVRQGEAGLGMARHGKAWLGWAWLGKARHGKGTGLQPPVHYIILQGLARQRWAWPGPAR